MKKLFLPLLLCLNLYCFGQGENNNYDVDSEDLKNILEGQGINIFKYPFKLKKGEYVSISYEIFELGKLKSKKHIIEDFQIENGIEISQHLSKKDTLVFHRFYFYENVKKDTLIMREFLPGIKTFQEIDLSNIGIGSFNSRTKVNSDLPKKTELMFYYGQFKEGKKIKDTNGWLTCSTGIPKNKLIEKYDFVILFYAEKIKKERTKTILKEIEKSTAHNNGY
jgi:hypothetical protein